ncbi:hypothetical protein O181_075161 [Austropuccinia psidii MF-1]|uniref:INO80 complex subunit B-like conserved region domain-containing protein n=1 Tax=Austropuccinia psidii MF-1 TaxID=1389203 RepID=A0A9Q3FE49_9BASI|nr:hypothetical protein [Austropuccinia psidii MF-1]
MSTSMYLSDEILNLSHLIGVNLIEYDRFIQDYCKPGYLSSYSTINVATGRGSSHCLSGLRLLAATVSPRPTSTDGASGCQLFRHTSSDPSPFGNKPLLLAACPFRPRYLFSALQSQDSLAMVEDSDDFQTDQVLYSEDEPPTHLVRPTDPAAPAPGSSSISTLSEASDPDADAEGEPDDLDADADGIEDDDAMDYSFDLTADTAQGVEGDSGEEEEDDEEDEDAEDDSGEEMELDENASSPPPSPPSRLSEQPQQFDTETTKKPLVLKLKLASQPTAVPNPVVPSTKRKYARKASASRHPASRNNRKSSTLSKRRDTDEEDELAEDALGSDSDISDDHPSNGTGRYQAWDESDDPSSADDPVPTVGQLTVRQRAKEYGEQIIDLQSLPMSDGKKKKELTEADKALEKAERSRKRKHQNEKRLEDEKTETINRLLKGQVGKAGRSSGSKSAALDAADDATNQASRAARPPSPPPLPTMIRLISSIRSGDYVSSLNIPSSILEDYLHEKPSPASPVVYPPPTRPAPPSWRLVNGVRVT